MHIVKIGGGKSINLDGIVADIASWGTQTVVVHGANALRDKLAQQLGKERTILTSASGYQSVFSDEDAIDLMMMAYSGLRNKRLVEKFQQQGVNAIGLTGLDAGLIRGRRNKGIRSRQGEKTVIVRDFSGKPKELNDEFLRDLLSAGYTPVLCPPILDEQGHAINTENDDIVALLQRELRAERVFQLIEAPGFLEDPEDPGSVVARMNRAELEAREAAVTGRMKRKMLALRKTCEHGYGSIHICDGRIDSPLQSALQGAGTIIS